MPIKIEQVSHIYQKGTLFEQTALNNISLTVKDGDILGIMGESGSGKSTLLQLINGLLPLQEGLITVDGTDIKGLKSKELPALRRKVGLVFQFAEEQIFEATVYDEVAFAPRNSDLSLKEIEMRVQTSLEAVGLPYLIYKDRKPHTLSSGEKRRLAIAGILAARPAYLLLDEPTAGLDYEGRQSLYKALVRLNKNYGTTIVIVSHHLEHLLPICNRLIVISRGKAVIDTDITNLLGYYNQLQALGIEPAVFHQIIYKLNQRGWNISTKINSINEAALQISQNLKM